MFPWRCNLKCCQCNESAWNATLPKPTNTHTCTLITYTDTIGTDACLICDNTFLLSHLFLLTLLLLLAVSQDDKGCVYVCRAGFGICDDPMSPLAWCSIYRSYSWLWPQQRRTFTHLLTCFRLWRDPGQSEYLCTLICMYCMYAHLAFLLIYYHLAAFIRSKASLLLLLVVVVLVGFIFVLFNTVHGPSCIDLFHI